MTWEERLFAYLDDLEQQAEGVFGLERDLEVAERAAAEYAVVTLASRLMASVDGRVSLQVQGLGHVHGELRRVADGWCLVAAPAQSWVIRSAAIMTVRGASPRSVPELAWPVTGRLGFGSALRRLAEDGERCQVVLLDGTRYDAQVVRVGHDFAELLILGDSSGRVLVGLAMIAAAGVTDG
jgi:hypothetical protein